MFPEVIVDGRRIALVGLAAIAIAAAALFGDGPAAKMLLVLSFAAAVMNIVFSERTAGEVSPADLLILLIAGFAASAHGAASMPQEAGFALLRVTLLGAAVGGVAWLYERWRGSAGLAHSDIALIAILAAFMPMAVSIYAVACAVTLTISVLAALHLYRGDQLSRQSQLPIASSLSVLYFCVWIAYRLNTEGNL